MRRVVSTMFVAVVLSLGAGAAQVNGQAACTFEQGFATLRDLVGAQTVGACLENERFNPDNGNTEQLTTGGLLVWRKADNFTAFTDGGTTWVNGPNGLQSRPNNERLAWEVDPVAPAPAAPAPAPRPLPTLPVTEPIGPIPPPRVLGGPESGGAGTIAAPTGVPQPAVAAAPASPAAPAAPAAPPAPPAPAAAAAPAAPPAPGAAPAAPPAAAAPDATPAPASAPAAASAPPPPPPGPSGGPPSASVAAASATPTPTPKPTKTPTPKPAVTAKFTERPDDVDTGNDARFEVETNAKSGSCTLVVSYRNSSDTPIGPRQIDDDGRCEWKYTLPADTKTGKAKAVVTVAANGSTTTVEDTFEVKKGDTVYAGSVDLEVDLTDMPENVDPGQEVKIGIDTNLKRKGSCALTVAWPKVGPVGAGSLMPDESGRCSWKVKVPADVPPKTSASLTVTVYKDSVTVRTLTKEFKISK